MASRVLGVSICSLSFQHSTQNQVASTVPFIQPASMSSYSKSLAASVNSP